MKMLLIIYDVTYDEQVMETLSKCCVTGFTKWEKVLGKGKRSEPKMDDAIWPGYNCAVMVAAEPELESVLLSSLANLLKEIGDKALKVFAWPLEKVI